MSQGRYDRLGDRRSDTRFEIRGELCATLETSGALPLLNFGSNGVLVESNVNLPLGSTHHARIYLGDRVADITVVVRHVRPSEIREEQFAVGFAFVDLPGDLRLQLEALTHEQGEVSPRLGGV